jgi:hypothetical protein
LKLFPALKSAYLNGGLNKAVAKSSTALFIYEIHVSYEEKRLDRFLKVL